jgi:hypothetical protein
MRTKFGNGHSSSMQRRRSARLNAALVMARTPLPWAPTRSPRNYDVLVVLTERDAIEFREVPCFQQRFDVPTERVGLSSGHGCASDVGLMPLLGLVRLFKQLVSTPGFARGVRSPCGRPLRVHVGHQPSWRPPRRAAPSTPSDLTQSHPVRAGAYCGCFEAARPRQRLRSEWPADPGEA